MKKLILIFGLMFALPCMAQTKVDSVQYQKFVKVPVTDLMLMLNGMNELKESVMYNPKISDPQKVQAYKSIDDFIIRMQNTLKVDSIKTVSNGKNKLPPK